MKLALESGRELPICIELAEIPGFLRGAPNEGMAPTWIAYPTHASKADFGEGRHVLCIDRDADGRLWEVGRDALLFGSSRNCVALREQLVLGDCVFMLKTEHLPTSPPRVRIVESRSLRVEGINDGELRAAMLLNSYRTAMGIRPLLIDERLTRDCREHCYYLKHHGSENTHEQDRNSPFHTTGGQSAAESSCIHMTSDCVIAVEEFLSCLYHKVPLVQPAGARLGIAGRDGYSVVDGYRGVVPTTPMWPIVAPGHTQTTDILEFARELPDPRPADSGGGATILVLFDFHRADIRDVRANLRVRSGHRAWKDVPIWLSCPARPAEPSRGTNDGCICMIPQLPLTPNMTYRPRVEYRDSTSGVLRVLEWEFHTK